MKEIPVHQQLRSFPLSCSRVLQVYPTSVDQSSPKCTIIILFCIRSRPHPRDQSTATLEIAKRKIHLDRRYPNKMASQEQYKLLCLENPLLGNSLPSMAPCLNISLTSHQQTSKAKGKPLNQEISGHITHPTPNPLTIWPLSLQR